MIKAVQKWIILLVIVCAILFISFQQDSIKHHATLAYYTRPKHNLHKEQLDFWWQLHKDLVDFAPSTQPLEHPENTDLAIEFQPSKPRKRPDILSMSNDQLESLRTAHHGFVNKTKSHDYNLPYTASTRGIVTTAGGAYLPIALVSIRMLRETGSSLPVEVFLADWSEWDPVICGKIFPELNAKCLVFQDIFDAVPATKKDKVSKYQFKVDNLFREEPFKSTGLVLWPDFWYRSESPLFFEIAGIPTPDLTKIAATEAGQILYSKEKHEPGLLLAVYYNYYGPDFYYPLQSQGAPGEGDKDTFIWSAVVHDEPYYTVKHPVHAMGYNTKGGTWRGSAMAQFDPTQDHIVGSDGEAVKLRPYFAHVNFPKLDPARIFDDQSFGADGPTRDSDGSMRRIWQDSEKDAIEFFGEDIERKVWAVVKDIACSYEGKFNSWKGIRNVCQKAEEYWNAIYN